MVREWAVIALVLFSLAVPVGAAEDPAPDAPWPHTYTGPEGGTLVVYEPQVDSWENHRVLEARMAVAITLPGAKQPVLGVLWIRGMTDTDLATGMVKLHDIKLVRSSFPSVPPAEVKAIEGKLVTALGTRTPEIPLASVLTAVPDAAAAPAAPAQAAAKLGDSVPQIFYSDTLAILVALDGKPVLAPVGEGGLSYVVNTNWHFFSVNDGWYLLDGESWLTSAEIEGPWQPAGKLPTAFSQLPNDELWKGVRERVPGKPIAADKAPKVFVSSEPAEIIVVHGQPKWASIPSTGLRYIENTDQDVFLESKQNEYYVLFGGRWFKAASLQGPWAAVGNDLPADFAKIPPSSPRGSVLVSVPGTSQAKEAVARANVPKTTTVQLKAPPPVKVSYSGKPEFKPVPGTSLEYAVNTPYQVLLVGSRYYVCYQGVWYVGSSPNGPWAVAAAVPQEIYTIPPSSPLYPVTFVRVYDSTPTTVVYGYTSGYTGTYVMGGTVVYGTGFYYPPYVYYPPAAMPIYYGYPTTYSAATWYNPDTGAYGRGAEVVGPYGAGEAGWAYNPNTGAYAHGAAAYGPYGGAGRVAGYNPTTGTYGRGAAVYGPYGGAGAATAYNPTTGGYAHAQYAYGPDGGSASAERYNPNTNTYASTQQSRDGSTQTGSSQVTRNGQTANAQHTTTSSGTRGSVTTSSGTGAAGYHSADGNNTGVAKTQSGDVYAGHDGNVYKHDSDGWSKYDDGSWNQAQKPSGTTDSSARQNDFASSQRASGSGTANQARSGGGFGGLDQDLSARRAGGQGSGLSGLGGLRSDFQGRFGGGEGGGGRFDGGGGGGFQGGGGRFDGGGGFGGGGRFSGGFGRRR